MTIGMLGAAIAVAVVFVLLLVQRTHLPTMPARAPASRHVEKGAIRPTGAAGADQPPEVNPAFDSFAYDEQESSSFVASQEVLTPFCSTLTRSPFLTHPSL